MIDGQVVVSGAWTRSVDDVVAGAVQTTEDGAVGVPRLVVAQKCPDVETSEDCR